jgi:hypothetical protein
MNMVTRNDRPRCKSWPSRPGEFHPEAESAGHQEWSTPECRVIGHSRTGTLSSTHYLLHGIIVLTTYTGDVQAWRALKLGLSYVHRELLEANEVLRLIASSSKSAR